MNLTIFFHSAQLVTHITGNKVILLLCEICWMRNVKRFQTTKKLLSERNQHEIESRFKYNLLYELVHECNMAHTGIYWELLGVSFCCCIFGFLRLNKLV